VFPIVTPAEMGDIDADAPEPVEVLIGRAGWATARAARRMLGRPAGRRVVVVAGPGNNGADGRAAAAVLSRSGVHCRVVDVADAPARLAGHDLVIDAAYGTGFRGSYDAPEVAGAPVLAVDIPSGLDGLTGVPGGRVLRAQATVCFAALKPGLLLGAGAEHTGRIEVVDIGLDVGRARSWLLDATDLAARWPGRPRDTHKWQAACWVIGGSPGMTGAPRLATRGAQRAGAGYVRLSVPGSDVASTGPVEAVGVALPVSGWAGRVLTDVDRVAAVVVGPGLGAGDGTAAEVRHLLAGLTRPVVVDGDALSALGVGVEQLRDRSAPTVLTPHDGEFTRLAGRPPGPDRLADARELAARSGAVVLLKGPTTVVADPDGRVLVCRAGDQRLATAGTGDVLSGIIGALLAQGCDPWWAAGLAAEVHGRAAMLGPAIGLVAADVAELVPAVLADPAVGRPLVVAGEPVR
jgi:ADP-dependent NAD(P)H-hydrate dehydratase / NAD(P)H-hydrate epimerase